MKVEKGRMIALGYGKFFRSDRIAGIEPIEEGRGPGRRTYVFVDNIDRPLIASRSESAILHDLVEAPEEITASREQYELIRDVLDAVQDVNPVLRSIVRDQAGWDLDRLEERIKATVGRRRKEQG